METRHDRDGITRHPFKAGAVLCLAFVASLPAAAQFDLNTLGDDTRRALVIQAEIAPADASQVIEVFVANGPPRVHFGNPQQMLVAYFDLDGQALGEHFAWDPRWVFDESPAGNHDVEILDQARGSFQVPLSSRLGQVRISSLDAAGVPTLLLTVDTSGVVTGFCTLNPEDANCGGGFNRTPSDDAAGPYEVIIGQAVSLDGSGSSDPDDNPLAFTWDFDGDEIFGETAADSLFGDENGVAPLFSAAQVNAPGILQVALKVCDTFGQCDLDQASINVLPDSADGDEDGDGVADAEDVCPGTVIPESLAGSASAPQTNRWAIMDDSGFFTQGPPLSGRNFSYSIEDSMGCSCEQIVIAMELGSAHQLKGCTTGELREWSSSLQ